MKIASELLIGALLLTSPATASTEWLSLGMATTGDRYYARMDDLAGPGPETRAARLWLKVESSRPQVTEWSEVKTVYVVDCATETVRQMMSVFTYPDGTGRTQQQDGLVKPIIPDSMLSRATGIMCSPVSTEDTR